MDEHIKRERAKARKQAAKASREFGGGSFFVAQPSDENLRREAAIREARNKGRQEVMSDNQTNDLSGLAYFIGGLLQAVGIFVIVFSIFGALSDALTVSTNGPPGTPSRVFNLQLAHGNLIALLSGGFSLIYGRLLQLPGK